MSRRYLNTPDWRGLLEHFAERISKDPFSYNSYVSKATAEGFTAGQLPKVAELIQRDFDEKWFANPEMRSEDEAVRQDRTAGSGILPRQTDRRLDEPCGKRYS